MHSMTRGAALALAGLSLAAPSTAQQSATEEAAIVLPPDGTSLVFVNSQAILPIAPGADSAQSAFQVVLRGFEGELAALATEIDEMLATYRQQEALMDAPGRQLKQEEIVDKQRALQTRQQELEVESDRRRNELLAPIAERVTQVIEEIRGERGYAIVLDIAESGVIAADNALDITAAVLERLGIDPSLAAAGTGR